MSLSVIEIIQKRKSVRSFTGKSLNEELIHNIKRYINQLSAPFGAKARVEFISTDTGEQSVKLGTYGVIRGARHFLALLIEEGPMAEVGAGYLFEELILYCTQLGLGTCWLGASFKAGDFLAQIDLRNNEKLVIISPVGYSKEKRTRIDSLMRMGAGSDRRKPFGSLFFKDSFTVPLTPEDAGRYRVPLEMVRFAPSGSNKQPWRIVKEQQAFHFYHQVSRFSLNDIGIALCHFELTCNELHLNGRFTFQENVPQTRGLEYVLSWMSEC